MKLSEHKFVIALVLSGLVHSLLLFGSFKNSLLVQLPLAEMGALHLEFVQQSSMENSLQQIKEESKEETEKMHVIRQEVVSQRVHQFIQKKSVNEATRVKSSAEVAEGNPNQKKQLTKEAENDSRLAQLVYQAINQHKRFPYMARRLRQQGKVTVNFVMHPDGMVTDVMVIESSNYLVLDKAAQEAVAAISPFAMASDYLRYEKVFDVAVDFRLN